MADQFTSETGDQVLYKVTLQNPDHNFFIIRAHNAAEAREKGLAAAKQARVENYGSALSVERYEPTT